MKCKAYAKINLTLEILNKREDGYHEIETLMRRVNLFDEIEINIEEFEKNQIDIACSDKSLNGKNNLCYKTVELFLKTAKIDNAKIDINIIKNIPSQAGLGGASSDAACVLIELNKHFNNAFNEEDLIKLGALIGADVPFFVKNVSVAWCSGIGEQVTPKNEGNFLDISKVLIVKPKININTKEAFEEWDKSNNLNRVALNDFSPWIFEKYENILEIKKILWDFGAERPGISGSGSALFGIFWIEDFKKAEDCLKFLQERDDIEMCGIYEFV